jgi:hypothetical protein
VGTGIDGGVFANGGVWAKISRLRLCAITSTCTVCSCVHPFGLIIILIPLCVQLTKMLACMPIVIAPSVANLVLLRISTEAEPTWVVEFMRFHCRT